MGYTHYWSFEPNKVKDTEELRKKFKRASHLVKGFVKFIDQYGKQIPIKICGGLGKGKPIFNDTEIWFNGDESQGLDHETFDIHWNRPNYHGKWNDFCKTARKPYDLIVCFALLVFADTFGEDVFQYCSDGTEEDWKEAYHLYECFTGKEPIKLK
jgi:hypothetical protein